MPSNPAPTIKYPFVALPEEDGSGWSIVFPDLPGAIGFAEDWDEVGEEARIVAELWIEGEREDGHPIPVPSTDWDPIQRGPNSFRFEELKTTREVAEELGVSHRRVNALSTNRGVGRLIGGVKMFTPHEVGRLQRRDPGRPRVKQRIRVERERQRA